MSSSINWSSVYNTPIGQILQDLNPSTFAQLITQGTEGQVSTYTSQEKTDKTDISAWSTLQSDAQAFSSDLASLSSASTYNQLATTSSNDNVATAVDQSAQQGSYTLHVGALAQAEIDTGSTAQMKVTNPNAVLTVPGSSGTTDLQGSFTIAVGSSSVAVNVSAGTSLNQLATQINQSGSPVTASVVKNSTGDWLLEIQANQTGQAITYTDSAPTSSSSQPDGPLYYLGILSDPTDSSGVNGGTYVHVLQASSQASVSLGGSSYNSSDAISSNSNTFTNLIPGMTVTVNATGSASIDVGPNTSAMVSSVQKFVSDWNQWVKDTQNLAEAGQVVQTGTGASAAYSYVSNNNQVLTTDVPMSVLDAVQQVIGSATNGTTSTYQSMGDIGITFNGEGKMSLNTGTLTEALTNDPSAVQSFFSTLQNNLNGTGSIPGLLSGFSQGPASIAGKAIATLNVQQTQDESKVSLLNQQVTNEEQQAIQQYGKWVNQVAQYSDEYSLLNALFNPPSSNSSHGG